MKIKIANGEFLLVGLSLTAHLKFLLRIVVAFLLSYTESFTQNGFQLDIIFHKDTFLVGERVDYILIIKNNSDMNSEALVNTVLQNQKNESVPVQVWGSDGKYKRSFFPNEEKVYLRQVDWNYGKLYNNHTFHRFLEPQRYLLEITIEDSDHQLQKQSFPFLVIEPEGDERYVGYTFLNFVTRNHTLQEGIDTLEFLWRNYPASNYIPTLLTALRTDLLFNKNYDRRNEILKFIVENYPTLNLAFEVLPSFLMTIDTTPEKIDYIKKIQAKVHGDLYKKLYQREIEKIEKNIK